MEEFKISRDKQNPTWAWVSNTDASNVPYVRCILLDVIDSGCVCVHEAYTQDYMRGKTYNVYTWRYFRIIKEPVFRPFKDSEEFVAYCKTITDMRVVNSTNKRMYTITHVEAYGVCISGYGSCRYDRLHSYFTWLDGSPIGVKE